jgi:proline dehydrogenase
MLRALFITLSRATWAQRTITRWPLAWKAASRFVAGEQPADAIRAVRELNDKGINVTLDHLGENITTFAEAAQATTDIEAMLDEIEDSGARANVSLKLTQIGLGLDALRCSTYLARILAHAADCHNFVRIDMEDSAYTEQTLTLYRQMRQRGFENTGVVIQSYLYRSGYDVTNLVEQRSRVRLTKGAYREPSDIAYPRKDDVDANYDRLAELLLGGALTAGAQIVSDDGCIPPIPAIATHDMLRMRL